MKITIEMKDHDVASLLVSALEFRNGIGLWGEIVSYRTPKEMPFRFDKEQVFKHIDYPMNPGGAVVIKEHEDGKKHSLTLPAIKAGLEVMASKYPHHLMDALNGKDDITTSDVFIQCCLFGEVRYG